MKCSSFINPILLGILTISIEIVRQTLTFQFETYCCWISRKYSFYFADWTINFCWLKCWLCSTSLTPSSCSKVYHYQIFVKLGEWISQSKQYFHLHQKYCWLETFFELWGASFLLNDFDFESYLFHWTVFTFTFKQARQEHFCLKIFAFTYFLKRSIRFLVFFS